MKLKRLVFRLSVGVFMYVTCMPLSQGQTDLEKYQQKYPNENGAFLKKNETVTITIGKEGVPIIQAEHEEERIFLTDNCSAYAEEEIGFSSFNVIEDVSPVVYIPNGDKYKSLKIKDIREESDQSGSVFHDDNRVKKFFYTSLQKGGKTGLTYSEEMLEPHFFGSFYFSSYLPVESSKYSLRTPADMDIKFDLFGKEKEKIEYRREEQGKYVVHTWEGKGLSRYNFEAGSVGFRHFATHLQVRIGDYKHKGEDRYYLRDVDDLYEYYRGFVCQVNTEKDEELEQLADSLTKDLRTNQEKVEAILYWVQDNIKYVAFEAGLGGFIPREADLVYNRRYGDCKDMSSILYQMINSVGIPAYYTWIGTREIPYGYNEVPTPAVDNHMICSYHDGERYVFLDATGKGIPYGMTTSFIQGKEALVGVGEKEYEIAVVPVEEMLASQTIDTVHLEIEEGLVKGKAKVTYSGYDAIYLSRELQNMSQSQRDEFFSYAFSKGNNKSKCGVDTYRGLEDRGGPLEFDYWFEIPDYVRKNGDELYINPFLKKYQAGAQIDTETTKSDRNNVFKNKNRNVVFIQIPEGYELDYLPEGFVHEHTKFKTEVIIKHHKEKKLVEVQTVFDYNYLTLEAEHFELWNQMIKSLNSMYSELIIFKKTAP